MPPGIHEATWLDIETKLAFNAHREKLIRQAREFITAILAPAVSTLPPLKLVMGGSYLSDKIAPNDIELTLYVPIMAGVEPLFQIGSESSHLQIKQFYGVDFYISVMVPGCNDLGVFFQYVGEKTAISKGLQEKDRRGVVEIKQWERG